MSWELWAAVYNCLWPQLNCCSGAVASWLSERFLGPELLTFCYLCINSGSMINWDILVDPFNTTFNTLAKVHGGLDTSWHAQRLEAGILPTWRLAVFCSSDLIALIPPNCSEHWQYSLLTYEPWDQSAKQCFSCHSHSFITQVLNGCGANQTSLDCPTV